MLVFRGVYLIHIPTIEGVVLRLPFEGFGPTFIDRGFQPPDGNPVFVKDLGSCGLQVNKLKTLVPLNV